MVMDCMILLLDVETRIILSLYTLKAILFGTILDLTAFKKGKRYHFKSLAFLALEKCLHVKFDLKFALLLQSPCRFCLSGKLIECCAINIYQNLQYTVKNKKWSL